MTQTEQETKNTQVWRAEKDVNGHPCLWMQAGVVKKKNCTTYYDCNQCKFDSGMSRQVAAGKQASWQDAMRLKDSWQRTCRHTMTGRIGPKVCPMNYNCDRCDFDQYLEDTLSPRTGHGAVHVENIKGFDIATGYYFHDGHTWATIDSGGLIRIGLDDFSMKVLGNPDAFEMPRIGQELNKDSAGWGIKRRDNLADVLSPVNGVITQVNEAALKKNPDCGKDPYGQGWLFTVHNSDIKAAFKSLMIDEESSQWMGEEVSILETMIEETAGPMSTDGGLLMPDVYGNLPELGWQNLTRAFLRTW